MPRSRRPRAILIGDEILAKVGGYVLGNFITWVIAGLGTIPVAAAIGLLLQEIAIRRLDDS